MHKPIYNGRTNMEISINCQQKKLQNKIDKLSYLNDLSDDLQIKYDRVFRSFNEIIELNKNHKYFNTLKSISKINTLANGLIKRLKNITEIAKIAEKIAIEKIEEIEEIEEMKETEELIDIRERIKIKQKSIIKWFNDSIIEKKGTKVRRSILYANYVSYCKENDLLPRKRTEVFIYIHGVMDTLVKNGGYHYFNGYELKN